MGSNSFAKTTQNICINRKIVRMHSEGLFIYSNMGYSSHEVENSEWKITAPGF